MLLLLLLPFIYFERETIIYLGSRYVVFDPTFMYIREVLRRLLEWDGFSLIVTYDY